MFPRKKRKVPGLNTTSTADISFMLLVFFLVTSSMDTDKGLPRQLPPPEEQTEETQEQIIKERNVLTLELDSHNRLTCNGQELTALELTRRVEDFVANTNDDPTLPEMSVREVHLMGRCRVSDRHVILIRTDRQATYSAYVEMQNAIVAAYNNLRTRLAMSRFHHTLAQCTSEERDAIVMVYPQRISEKQDTDSE